MRTPPIASFTAALLTAATITLLGPAPPATADHSKRRQTDYGLSGHAYGSLGRAESLGVGSGRTAPVRMGCTRMSGSHRKNHVASAGDEAGSQLRVAGVANSMATFRSRRQVGTRAVSRVPEAVLGTPAGPNLTFTGLQTRSRAFARRADGSLRATGSSSATSLVANTGTPLDLVLNEAGAGLDTLLQVIRDNGGTLPILGFGELQVGERSLRSGRHGAVARTSALRARLYGENGLPGGDDDVRVVLARSKAAIHDGVRAGVLGGRAVPLESVVGGDLLSVGRVNDRDLPCAGTRGKVRRSALAGADLGNAGLIEVNGLTSRVLGDHRRNRSALAWTESRVAEVSLGGGEVRMSGVVGRATVRTDRRGRVIRNSARGTRIGELVIGGEVQEAPSPGDVIDVPGVASLEFLQRDRFKRGSATTAVRVTLLPGTAGESVIDLGAARTVVKRR